MSRCKRCAKLREEWLRAMDQHTVDGRSAEETIEAHKREESAYQAYMNVHRTCTECTEIDPDSVC